MNAKKLKGCIAALILCLTGQASFANVLSITPLITTAGVDSQFELEIRMDFLQETVGGSFDFFYDSSLLDFVSFEYDAAFIANVIDSAFTLTPDNCAVDGSVLGGCNLGDAEINAIGFGNFDGIIGSHVVGRMVFLAHSPGLATFTMDTSDSPFGGFISAIDASDMSILYNGGKVLVVVPVPAAFWMMLGGLAVLMRVRRR